MKKYCILIIVMAAISAAGYTLTVGTTAVIVAAPAKAGGGTLYATGTVYTAGQIVYPRGGPFYIVQTGGTSTNAFTSGGDDSVVTQGSAVFVKSPGKDRKYMSVYNSGTNDVYLKMIGTPVAGDGVKVSAGSSVVFDVNPPNGTVRGIAENGASTISVTGW